MDGDDTQVNTPEPEERGRYALFGHPSGQGLLIYRATHLCDRCLACGCGDQQEVIDLSPGGVMAMAGKMGKLKALKGMIKL